MKSNSKTIEEGFLWFTNRYHEAMLEKCYNTGYELVRHALENKEFQGFTGNTQTSYAFGIYHNGKLYELFSIGGELPDPIIRKIRLGETIRLEDPYEGDARSVTGKVDILHNASGEDTSYRILKDYSPKSKIGFSLVVTTGTEYSTYLENARDLNVLTDTWQKAKMDRHTLFEIRIR